MIFICVSRGALVRIIIPGLPPRIRDQGYDIEDRGTGNKLQ